MANFHPGSYGIILRIINGYLVASSPEFGITITKRFDEIKKREEIGTLYFDLFDKIAAAMKAKISAGKPLPEPKKSLDMLPKNDPAILSVSRVAEILETSQDSVRRLVDDGSLKCVLTRKGHRRFRMSEVEKFLKTDIGRIEPPRLNSPTFDETI